jgi:alpha-beta hydrolase superfamily lysophospholipase
MPQKKRSNGFRWLRLALAVGTVTGAAAAYRFALKYRERVGLPHRNPVEGSPADYGLAFETVEIPADGYTLAAWFVPADASTERRPAIVVVHGWESNRGRTFAHVRYLHAAGFHCLVFDARGHGDNPPETLPVNVPEFAEDTAAAARWLAARADVSAVGVIGHSMGGAGAIVAAAREPEIAAVVSVSAPADLVWMTRKTFEMAEMHVPEFIATPLAWLTAAVLLIPRRHSVEEASAVVAAGRYRGPLLLIHGAQDHGVPVEHLGKIELAALESRDVGDGPVESLILPDFGHRWLYEDPDCRRKVAAFFARSLGGPIAPEVAAERAAECVVERPSDPVYGFGALASKTPPPDRPIYNN